MKHEAKFNNRQENQTRQQAEHEAHEFASSDELLRFDAAHTMVPPEVAQRLKESSARITPEAAPRPWWKTLFGR